MKFRALLHRGVILTAFFSTLAGRGSLFGQETVPEQEAAPIQVAQATPLPASEEGLISLDFRQAELQTVLQALARKAKVNIVTSPDASGEVSIHLENVSWEQALDTIVKTIGLAYEKEDNVILVTTVEGMKSRREAVKALVEIEPVITKVIQLKYLDAADVKKFLEPQLTAQGKISVLEVTGQKGWEFGGASTTGTSEEDRERKDREKARSKAVVITDTPTTIDRLEKILTRIDVLPKQILIEARIMEVSRDLLRDLGLDIGTGQAGVETATALPTQLTLGEQNSASGSPTAISDLGAQMLGTAVAPSIFGPKSSISGVGAALTMGLELVFRKLNEPQFQVILRALEEDIRTNTLSAPHIITLSGQEARILVGTKYPIITRTVSGGDSPQTTESLERYQDIGIELFVVPQVGGDRHIDLIVHPVVSSRTGTVGTNAYPILDVRETETQIIMEDGETIVIGGLLKDVKARSKIGLPFLGKLPLIGPVLQRTTTDMEKIDLLIFITAKLVEPGALSEEQQESLRRSYEEFSLERHPKKSKRRKAPSRPETVEAVTEQGNRGTLYRKR
jgi:type IV pilus assembly protein PilQ